MFSGVYTAIVTPFDRQGRVDYGKLRDLIAIQAANGVAGIVPVGTTGESPTLDVTEHEKVIETAVEAAGRDLQVIAGTGGNATSEALTLTRFAKEAGVCASLQVTPYYNKPSQEGLYRHFSEVADVGLPVVLYNVPGRASCEIAVDTVVRLAAHPNIKAIKEAGGSVDRVSAILSRCDIVVLSGDDSLAFPMMALGARGVISVASNVAPKAVSEMASAALAGQWEEARRLHYKLYPLYTDLFIDTNPVPVKAAMAMMGMIEETYRLPLCPMTEPNRQALRKTLQAQGLLG